MNDRKCFESLARSMKDLFGNIHQPFGGKSILLGGDFRQTLPVIPKSSKSTILASSLPRSYLWKYFKLYKLNENMCLQRSNLNPQDQHMISTFSSWLLDVGDGKEGTPDTTDPQNTKKILIPNQYLIPPNEYALTKLIQFIYDNDTLQNPTAETLSTKAIVCCKNDTVDELNSLIINMNDGTTTTYTSVDSIVPHPGKHGDTEVLYPTEYLNLLNFNGFPTHSLQLKVKAPIILLRNLNPMEGLCNGTRLIVTQLLPRIIEAEIMTGKFIGRRVFLPKITLTYKDKQLPFDSKRKQFPVKLCYAMTINKS